MAFCNMCGTQIADGTFTCAACAGRSSAASAAAAPAQGMADNVAGMLAYITIIPAIVFLLVAPYNRNRFIRFHAWQNIFFVIAWTVLWMALSIVVHIPFLGWLSVLIWPLIVLAGFILWIVLLLKANQGQMYKLPVIGDLAEKQANAM
jgi:Predicted membrane protein